jgi:hypothetical protein
MQFDAGPGDRTDREWKLKERKSTSQARRQRPRITLPNWAFVVIPVAALAIIGLVITLIVRAIAGGGGEVTPTEQAPAADVTTAPVNTPVPTEPAGPTPTFTYTLPDIDVTSPPPVFTEIGVGATVVVQGTAGGGLNLREQPSPAGPIVITVPEAAALTVVDGPREGDGYTWWLLRTEEGSQGWGAGDWLVLQQQP